MRNEFSHVRFPSSEIHTIHRKKGEEGGLMVWINTEDKFSENLTGGIYPLENVLLALLLLFLSICLLSVNSRHLVVCYCVIVYKLLEKVHHVISSPFPF
jgi:hypothetical protein